MTNKKEAEFTRECIPIIGAWFRNKCILVSTGVILVLFLSPSAGSTKELPQLLEISEVGKIYDGRRIIVFGWVRSAEVKSGRRGSLHLEIVVGEGEHSVLVYTIQPFPNIIHREVIVQGIYHERGRFAGHSVEHYIVADTIVRDWAEKENRH